MSQGNIEMAMEEKLPIVEKPPIVISGSAAQSNRYVQYILLALQVVAVLCFAFMDVKYTEKGKSDYTEWAYGHFQDVHVMIYIGFGFLMTFLQDYNWSSCGFNFMLGAVAIEWAMIVSCVLDGKLQKGNT